MVSTPIIQFKESIDYTDYLPQPLLGNDFWETLIEVWSAQDNLYIYKPTNLLRQIRDNYKNVTDSTLLVDKLGRYNINVPSNQNQLSYLNYLTQSISSYYRTAGNSTAFSNLMSYISNTSLTYTPLFATLTTNASGTQILDINSLTPITDPTKLFINGGSYYPTPYYSIIYNPEEAPNLDFELLSDLINQLQPIYLVLKGFIGRTQANGTLFAATNQIIKIKQYCVL